MELCMCGSGLERKFCHPNVNTDELRRLIRYTIKFENREVKFKNQFSAGDGVPSTFEGEVLLSYAMTPAGEIFYPLLVMNKQNRALRPLTIDGIFQFESLISVTSMITPLHTANIIFDLNDLHRFNTIAGRFLVKCIIKTSGNPFISVFALESNFRKKRIALYHHTNEATEKLILSSMFLKGSKWNIQGTEEHPESDHIYFTDIPSIQDDRDLWDIAMCNKGFKLQILSDRNEKEEIQVYRDNPLNRPSAIKVWIPIEMITPNHVILHNEKSFDVTNQFGGYSWWEIFKPSIYRVAVAKNTGLPLARISKTNELLLVKDENLLIRNQFIGALGIDMHSLKMVWTEKQQQRRNHYPSDYGMLDDRWIKIWNNNLASIINPYLQEFIRSGSFS